MHVYGYTVCSSWLLWAHWVCGFWLDRQSAWQMSSQLAFRSRATGQASTHLQPKSSHQQFTQSRAQRPGPNNCRTYIFIYIYIYVSIYLSLSIYIYIYSYVFIHIYIYIYVYVYIHVYVYIYIYIYIYTYTYVYIHITSRADQLLDFPPSGGSPPRRSKRLQTIG